MAVIHARQTVGLTHVISLTELPADGLGTEAPIATLALVNVADVGSIWFKSGPLDTDWLDTGSGSGAVTSVNGQTGVVVLDTEDIPEGASLYFTEARVRDTVLTGLSLAISTAVSPTDSVLIALGKLQAQSSLKWNFASATTEMNDSTGNVFFGTKSGNNNITMYRNNVEFLKFNITGITSNQSIEFNATGGGGAARRKIIGTGGLEISTTTAGLLDLVGSGGIRLLSTEVVNIRSGTSTAYPIFLVTRRLEERLLTPALNIFNEISVAEEAAPLDADSTFAFTFPSNFNFGPGFSKKINLDLFLRGSAGGGNASAVYQKTIHIDESGIVDIQDDFTSLNINAVGVFISSIVIGGISNNDLIINFSGIGGLTGKTIKGRAKFISVT